MTFQPICAVSTLYIFVRRTDLRFNKSSWFKLIAASFSLVYGSYFKVKLG